MKIELTESEVQKVLACIHATIGWLARREKQGDQEFAEDLAELSCKIEWQTMNFQEES